MRNWTTTFWRHAGRSIAIGLALLATVWAQAPLTLPLAVQEALHNSPRLRAAAAEQNKARAGVSAARAGRLPRVDVREGFTRSDNPVYVFGTLLTQQRFTQADFALPALNQPAPLNNFQTRAEVSVPIFDARQSELRVHEARLAEQVAGEAAQQVRQAVLLAVIRAYYDLSAHLAELQVAESAERTAAAGLHMADSRYRAGLVVESDRLSAQVFEASAREQLIAARNAVTLAAAALNRELGRPLDAPVALAGDDPTQARMPAAASLAALVADAQRLRPELRQQRKRLQIAGSEVTRARAAFLPTLDGIAAWERDQLHFTNTGAGNWTVGVSLNFNLFHGGADRAAVASALAERQAAQARLEDLSSAVDLQVRQAWYAVATAAQQLAVSGQTVQQAAAALKIVQNRYSSGLATVSDLLRAQTELTSARTQRVQAAYALQISQANRDLAVGTLSPASAVVTQRGETK